MLKKLGIQLPEVSPAIGNYVDAQQVGKFIFLSGRGPRNECGDYIKGKLGVELTVKEGYYAARITAINQIAVLRKELGSLDKIKRIVKVNAYVNSAPFFYDQPGVVNGFSDLLVALFGKSGRHARTAVGVNALPLNMALEVEMIVEVK